MPPFVLMHKFHPNECWIHRLIYHMFSAVEQLAFVFHSLLVNLRAHLDLEKKNGGENVFSSKIHFSILR